MRNLASIVANYDSASTGSGVLFSEEINTTEGIVNLPKVLYD